MKFKSWKALLVLVAGITLGEVTQFLILRNYILDGEICACIRDCGNFLPKRSILAQQNLRVGPGRVALRSN